MVVTLAQFLAHDSVQRADPEYLGHVEDLERAVRWVHSSEIYEIAPLLSGGEVLLTTGLGLAGADAGSRRHWVRDVTASGVTAVALEPGRSLPTVPAEVADEARRVALPLIVLRRVVPFAEICREVNSDVLSADLSRLRRTDLLVRTLHDVAADGAGLAELVTHAAAAAHEPVQVRTLSGQLVASASPPAGHDRRPGGPAEAPVRATGVPWGFVLVGTEVTPDTQFLADRVAAVVGLVVERSTSAASGASAPGVALLTDLLDRPFATTGAQADLLVRTSLAGFHPDPRHQVVGLAGSCADPHRAAVLFGRTPRLGPHLLGPVRGQVLGLVDAGDAADPAGQVARVLDEQARHLAAAVVVVGPPVDLARAGESLARARDGLALGPAAHGATTWRRSTAVHLLAQVPRQHVDSLVEDALGPLRAWDRNHGTSLVLTLAAWIEHGLNTSSTARALHVRRQTLHQRLARMGTVLGYDLTDGRELAHLVVATAAARQEKRP